MNKTKARAKCQEILRQYNINHVVNESDQIKFLLTLFSKHPDWEEKMGVGVEYIYIGVSSYGNKCFFIKRMDATLIDISFNACLDGSPTKLAVIKSACRHAIKDIIQKKRQQVLIDGATCPITQDPLINARDFHIDHYDLTFAELFNYWIENKNIDTIYLATNTGPNDTCSETKFTDQLIKQDFINFHNANTHLRAVSVFANQSILRRP